MDGGRILRLGWEGGGRRIERGRRRAEEDVFTFSTLYLFPRSVPAAS